MSDVHEVQDVEYVPEQLDPHDVTDVEYVPVCEKCWKPAEQFDVQDERGVWRHGGFRHVDRGLNPGGAS